RGGLSTWLVFFSSRRRHTRSLRDWSSDVCSSDLTTERLDELMGATHEPDRVFHYLPFNFAASTILLLSCLARESVLTLSTDLNRSEERRVGKECISRWSPSHRKK